MENREVNVVLLSNDRNFKWDFINFYSHTYSNKCLIPCKLQINGTEVCLGGEEPEGEKKNVIDAKFKAKGTTIRFMGTRYQELKKTKLNKILPELKYIDAVICMFSKLYPNSFLLTAIETLLEQGDSHFINRFFFVKNEHTLSLEHINMFFRYVANKNVSKEYLLPYNFPMYSKLIEKNFNLGQTNVEPGQFTEAKNSFEKFLNMIIANTSNIETSYSDLSVTTRNLHNEIRQLFELLCEIFSVLKINESALEKAISNKDNFVEQKGLRKEKSMLVCNNSNCSKPQIVTSTGSHAQPCFNKMSEVNLIQVNCTRCNCLFNEHRITDYMNNFIYVIAFKECDMSPDSSGAVKIETVQSFYGVETLNEAIASVRKSISLAMKFIESITIYGHIALKLNYDFYKIYIDANRALHPILHGMYGKKSNILKKCTDKAYIIFNCFNELKHSPHLYKLIIENFEEKRLNELKDMVWSTKDVLKKSNSMKNLPQQNDEIQQKSVTATVTEPTTDAEIDVENIKFIKLMQETIRDFTEEMKDLRKICKSNQEGIAKMSCEITCLRAEIAFLRSEVTMQDCNKS